MEILVCSNPPKLSLHFTEFRLDVDLFLPGEDVGLFFILIVVVARQVASQIIALSANWSRLINLECVVCGGLNSSS